MSENNKTKILYVITKSNWGGAQRYVFDLATSLPPETFEIMVVSGGDGILNKKLHDFSIRTISVPSMRRDISFASDLKTFFAFYRIFRTEKPNTIHLNSPKAAGFGSLAGRLAGIKKIITTVHGFAFNEPRPFYQKLLIKFFTWITMILSHKVIVIANREYEQARKFWFIKKKIVLISLGIKPIPNLLKADDARREIGKIIGVSLQNKIINKIIVGTIAELHPNKGLPYLIDAMSEVIKKHPDTTSVIIGDGQERNNLIDQIKNRGLDKSVFLAGFIDNAPDFLNAFDIFVLPSLKEGLPYVLLEAGLASLAIIATNVGGIPDIIKNNETGFLIPPKNTQSLAEAISFLIDNKDKREAVSRSLQVNIKSQFSFEKMLGATENLYH